MTTQAVTAVIATAAGGPITGAIVDVGTSFIHSSDAGPNEDAANALAPLALGGNVIAMKVAYKRGTYTQVRTSASPWQALWAAIVAKYPDAGNIAGDGPTKPPGVPEEWLVGVAPGTLLPLVQQWTAKLGPAANIAYYTNSGGHVVTPTSSTPPANGAPGGAGGMPTLTTAGFVPTTPLGWFFAIGLIIAAIVAWRHRSSGGAS